MLRTEMKSLRINDRTLLEIPPCIKSKFRGLPSMAWQMALGSHHTQHEPDIIPVGFPKRCPISCMDPEIDEQESALCCLSSLRIITSSPARGLIPLSPRLTDSFRMRTDHMATTWQKHSFRRYLWATQSWMVDNPTSKAAPGRYSGGRYYICRTAQKLCLIVYPFPIEICYRCGITWWLEGLQISPPIFVGPQITM